MEAAACLSAIYLRHKLIQGAHHHTGNAAGLNNLTSQCTPEVGGATDAPPASAADTGTQPL
jgi:hypothetical protein